MTHTRQMADSEGDFGGWKAHARACAKLVPSEIQTDGGQGVHRPVLNRPCGAPVEYRVWESSDGAYEDEQYRCANGHTWWVDGIDS